MNRRGFFGSFAKRAAVAGAVAAVPAKAESVKDPNNFFRHKWRYVWSGYYKQPLQDVQVAHWIAYPPEESVIVLKPRSLGITMGYFQQSMFRGVYATTGGVVAWFRKGDMFPLYQSHDYSKWLDGASTEEELEQAKQDALYRLTLFVDEFEQERHARS